MKKTLFTFIWLTAFILFNANTYGQQNNTLSLVYGTGNAGLLSRGIGSAGYASKGFTTFGLDYMRQINGFFSIETGLEYTDSQLLLDYIDPPNPNFTPEKGTIQILSVPVYGNFTFFKHFFLNAGFSVDFETDNPAQRITSAQNGIGTFLGIGGKYTFRRVNLFVNPFFRVNNMIRFNSDYYRKLVDVGFKFGLGYSF